MTTSTKKWNGKTILADNEVPRDMIGLLKDRQEVAERLLEASAQHSFHDWETELDWDAPPEAGKWYWPPELVSLYDTPLWRRMSEEKRMELAQHEGASLLLLGVWLELVLMQLLLRHIYDLPVNSAHVRYALTEIGDETRHSQMFVRLVEKGGTPMYTVSRLHHNIARVMKTTSTTPGSFACTLLCEEILDWMQRLTFPDERIQPLVRGMLRIHVIEESRHVRYAREELRRQMVSAPGWERGLTRLTAGLCARVLSLTFTNKQIYANVGLDPREAVAQVKASDHRRDVLQTGARRLTDFLGEIGVTQGVSRRMWRASGLLG